MTNSTPATTRLENIRRQSKRLSKALDIPLFIARDVLSRAIYRCNGINDLKGVITSQQNHHHVALSDLHPGSTPEDIEYFRNLIPSIADRIRNTIYTKGNLVDLHALIWTVFGFKEKQQTNDDFFEKISFDQFSPLNIGPDPHAVIYTDVRINDQDFRLIGTRVFNPEWYNWETDEIRELLWSICPYHNGRFEIMWHEPDAWEAETRAVISTYIDTDDDDTPEFTPPQAAPTAEMKAHEVWLNDSTGIHRLTEAWEDQLTPVRVGKSNYLFLGFPIAPKETSCTSTEIMLTTSHPEFIESKVVTIADQPISINWIEMSEERRTLHSLHQEYYNEVEDSILSTKGAKPTLIKARNGHPVFAFISPASLGEVNSHLRLEYKPPQGKACLSIKITNPKEWESIIDLVYDDKFYYRDDVYERQFYVCHTSETKEKEPAEFISLEYKSRFFTGASNLIPTQRYIIRDSATLKILTISTHLINLTKRVTKKRLYDAIRYGLVLEVDSGIMDYIRDHEPGHEYIARLPLEYEKHLSPRRK